MGETNKFKNSVGRYYLRGLFYEETLSDKSSVVYTLKREDHAGYPSLYRLYMETADPTEYQFAVRHLDGWAHWLELSQAEWFAPYRDAWRSELSTRLRSEALAGIITLSKTETHPSMFAASKYLLEATEKPAGASKRGRPTKDEVKQELRRQAASEAEFAEDAKRLNLQ
jgi:hypothetical protein